MNVFLRKTQQLIICTLLSALTFFEADAQTTPVFYATTQGGGQHSLGAIISFNPANSQENVVWSFGSGTDASGPSGNLVYCSATGLFYGLATSGGANSSGAIFSFNPTTNQESVVWSFGGTGDGSSPYGDMVFDATNQLFYGLTSSGGTNSNGVVFSFNPATNAEVAVASFGTGSAPSSAFGNLVLNPADGLYYGLSEAGGSANDGAIFSFNPATGAVNVVASFNNTGNGQYPKGSLVYNATNSLFYGVTTTGGANSLGVLFSFNPSTNAVVDLHDFGSGNDGEGPTGNLMLDPHNNLYYGLVQQGGTNSTGIIYSFNPANNAYSDLTSFNGTDGSTPLGTMVYNTGNGLCYGLAQTGGTNNKGVVFSFNPSTNTETALWSFGSGTDGSLPSNSFVIYTGTNAVNNVAPGAAINMFPNPGTGIYTVTGVEQGQVITVFNVMGDKLLTQTANGSANQVNLNQFADGIYLLQITAADGAQIATHKLIKSN